MENPPPAQGFGNLKSAPRTVALRLFVIFENRLQLFLLELEEERERILRAIWLSLAAAIFGLLAVMVVSTLIVLACWTYSPVMVLGALAVVYAGGAAACLVWLAKLLRRWETLPATLDQLKKDRECLKNDPS